MTITILFVDDELDLQPVIRQTFQKEIRSQEYNIIFATSGVDALKIIEKDVENERRISLLVTDLKMPGQNFDGFSLIRTIRNRKIPLPVVILSAYGDFQNVQTAFKYDVFDFITKSSDANLSKTVMDALTRGTKFLINRQSQNVPYDTILQLSQELPSKKVRQLIENLIPVCKTEDLEEMQRTLPQIVKQTLKTQKVEIETPIKTAEQIKQGQIQLKDIDIEQFNATYKGYAIRSRTVKRNGVEYGPYYYLEWYENRKKRTINLGQLDK